MLFRSHMAQHLLLTSVAAPLLALGGIGSVLAAALPRRARPPLARTGLAVRRRPGAVAGIVVAAALAHAVALWAWHLPAAYDLAVRQDLAHLLEHASMLLTAVLLWAAALGSRRARALVALLALLVTAVHREGRLNGIDLPLMEDVVEAADVLVVAAGGVTSFGDLHALADCGVSAVVLGMVLYTGTLNARAVALEFAA